MATVVDEFGNYDLTSVGTVLKVAGKLGKGMYFDDTSHLERPDTAAFELTQFTIAGWLDASSESSNNTIIAYWDGVYPRTGWQLKWNWVENVMQFVIGAAGPSNEPGVDYDTLKTPSLETSNRTIFYAATYDGTTGRIYTADRLGNVTLQNSAAMVSPAYDGSEAFVVGALSNDNGVTTQQRVTNGVLDDIWIFDIALDPDQLSALIPNEPVPELSVSVNVASVVDTVLPGAYTTPTIAATVFGGVGPFTYSWTSDGAKLTADTSTASSTTYSGTGTDETTTETLTVTVTDTGNNNQQISYNITTNITWYANFTVDIDTADITTTVPNGTYNSPSVICNVVTGSGTTFFYTWTRLSGDNNLTPAIQTPGQSGPASPAQSWTGSGYNQQIQETWQCEVFNILTGQSATDTISYDVTYGTLPVLTAIMSPPSIQDYTESVPFTTQVAVVTVTNGVPPYTYSWTRVSGSTVMAADNAAAPSTTFTGSGSNETANEVWQCEVTDSTTPTPQTATADLLLNIEFADPPAALTVDVTPATLDVNGPNGYLTSGEATAAVSGGTPPYTYDWQISNITGQFYQIPPEPVTPSQASTRFRGLCVNTNGTVTYTCFVTDSTPGTPRTGSDSVTVTWYSF